MVPKMQSATLCVLGAGMSFPISAEGLVCFSVRLRFPFVCRAPPSAAMRRVASLARRGGAHRYESWLPSEPSRAHSYFTAEPYPVLRARAERRPAAAMCVCGLLLPVAGPSGTRSHGAARARTTARRK